MGEARQPATALPVAAQQPIAWRDGRQTYATAPAAPPASTSAVAALSQWEQMPHAFFVRDEPPAGVVHAQERRSFLSSLFAGASTKTTNLADPDRATPQRPAWLEALLAFLRGRR